MKVALVNDCRTSIKGTRTLWHYLEDGLGAEFFPYPNPYSDSGYDKFMKSLLDFKPDVVIANAFWGDIGLSNVKLGLDKRVRLIVLVQDNYHYLLSRGLLNLSVCKEKINDIQYACYVADKVVTIFPSLIRNYHIEDKAICIPHGVDGDMFYPSLTKSYLRDMYNIDKYIAIYVGDDTEIHGWSEVKKKIASTPDWTWILVSKNEKLDIDKSIIAFSKVNSDKLRELYSLADIFYARGHIGLPAIEAMFCNTPIDVSPTGYFEDWHPENKNPRLEALPRFEVRHVIKAWAELVLYNE